MKGNSVLTKEILSDLCKKGVELCVDENQLLYNNLQELDTENQKLLKDNQDVAIDLIKSEKSIYNAFPLSFSQQAFLFFSHGTYNLTYAIKTPVTHGEAWQKTFEKILAIYPSLRTTFSSQQQKVYPYWPVDFAMVEKGKGQDVEDIITALHKEPFKSDDNALRVRVIKQDDCDIAVFTVHTIAINYDAVPHLLVKIVDLLKEEGSSLSPNFAYSRCLEQQHSVEDRKEEITTYWKAKLEDNTSALQLPVDFSRSKERTYVTAQQAFSLDAQITSEIESFASKNNFHVKSVLLAIFQMWLSRYTHQKCIVTGTLSDVDEGGLSNFVPVCTKFEPSSVFDLMEQVHNNLVESSNYQNFSLPLFAQEAGFSPLFPSLFVFHDGVPQSYFDLINASNEVSLCSVMESSPFDLTLTVFKAEQQLHCSLQYQKELYAKETIQRWSNSFREFVGNCLRDVTTQWGKISILPCEQQQQINQWNSTAAPLSEKLVHDFFVDQVQKTPDSVAVIFQDQELTYAELNERSTQLCSYLIEEKNIQVGDIVGVHLNKNIDMVVSVVAILKAGAAYLPLDPQYPEDRLQYMIEKSQTRVVISEENIAEIDIDYEKVIVSDIDHSNTTLATDIQIENAAYVLFTSGSTGMPKGVEMPHRALTNLILWHQADSRLQKPAKTLCFAPISFDVSFQEMFTTWCSGGTLYLITDDTRRNFAKLLTFINDYEIERFFCPYVAFQNLIEQMALKDCYPQKLQDIITAGEQLKIKQTTKQVFRCLNAKLHNHYGPTESHVVTAYQLPDDLEQWQDLPYIGKPIANTQIHLLDKNLQTVPVGVVGEIYIGGTAVASGYIHRPELTAERFVDDFVNKSNGKLYKTGDLARYVTDGNIEYIGRKDHQVKISGFRIELGEIENILIAMPEITKAIVTVTEVDNTKKLVAYAENAEQQVTANELKKRLRQQLPYYMVPFYFIVLDKFPINPNGKVDRHNLPDPIEYQQPSENNGYVPYSDEVEAQVNNIWQSLLAIENVTLEDDFFKLGGNSLLATQLLFEINKKFQCSIPLEDIYENSTLSSLSTVIKKIRNQDSNYHIVKIKSGTTQPLFVMPDIAGDTASFSHIIKYLNKEQTVYGFCPPAIYDDQKPLKSMKQMALFYIDLMKTIQPEGPYMLTGISMAGTLAFEVAQQLLKQKQQVSLLVLLDPDSGLSFGKSTLTGSLRTVKLLWHNMFYYLVRPKKMSYPLLVETVKAVKIIWQTDLDIKELDLCATEKEQYIYALNKLKEAKKFPSYMSLEQFQKIIDLVGINYLATFLYFPKSYPNFIHFFKPKEGTEDFTVIDYKKWENLSEGGIEFSEYDGNHFNFFLEPGAKPLGEKLQACINAVIEKQ